jgi:hypothetical protein
MFFRFSSHGLGCAVITSDHGNLLRLSAIACLRYFPGLVGIDQLETLGGQNEKLGLATRSLIEELKRN